MKYAFGRLTLLLFLFTMSCSAFGQNPDNSESLKSKRSLVISTEITQKCTENGVDSSSDNILVYNTFKNGRNITWVDHPNYSVFEDESGSFLHDPVLRSTVKINNLAEMVFWVDALKSPNSYVNQLKQKGYNLKGGDLQQAWDRESRMYIHPSKEQNSEQLEIWQKKSLVSLNRIQDGDKYNIMVAWSDNASFDQVKNKVNSYLGKYPVAQKDLRTIDIQDTILEMQDFQCPADEPCNLLVFNNSSILGERSFKAFAESDLVGNLKAINIAPSSADKFDELSCELDYKGMKLTSDSAKALSDELNHYPIIVQLNAKGKMIRAVAISTSDAETAIKKLVK